VRRDDLQGPDVAEAPVVGPDEADGDVECLSRASCTGDDLAGSFVSTEGVDSNGKVQLTSIAWRPL
jgi:hypothetical protein